MSHLLRLLMRSSPDCGDGPFTAPAPLVQAMLYSAAAANDGATIRSLGSLPQPPNMDGDSGRAITCAFRDEPPFSALQALVDCGASPHPDQSDSLLIRAAGPPACLPALRLLLPLCLKGTCETTFYAMHNAIRHGNIDAVALLLPSYIAASGGGDLEDMDEVLGLAAELHHPHIVRHLIQSGRAVLSDLQHATAAAARYGDAESLALLLDQGGVDVNCNRVGQHFEKGGGRGTPLVLAMSRGRAEPYGAQEEVVCLLLRHGAAVTPLVWERARLHKAALPVLALLRVAAAARRGAQA